MLHKKIFAEFELFVPHIFENQPIVAGFLAKPHNFLAPEYTQKFFDPQQKLCFSKQTQIHSDTVEEATETEKQADGACTKEKNMVCTTRFADCIGGLFYCPKTGEIAAIHAGWRGLSQKIFSKYLQKFSHPEKILVALSPSLGKCCAEFSDPFLETPRFFHPFVEKKMEKQEEKFFVDLWSIAKKELLDAGIAEKNLEMPEICTHCSGKNDWWSFRNGDKERGIGVIWKI